MAYIARERLDKVVKEWEPIGLVFDEHAHVAAPVFPGKPEASGLHGVLRIGGASGNKKGRWQEALAIAKKNGVHLLVNMEYSGPKEIWGGKDKFVYVMPTEIEIALISKEVIWALESKAELIRKAVGESFLYHQEDERVLLVEENLRLIERQAKDFRQAAYTSQLRPITVDLRHLVTNISKDSLFEGTLREQLNGQLQQNAATTICEGIRFLHAFR